MRTGLRILGVHCNEAVTIGDHMDTDVIAGIETRPRLIPNGVGDIPVLEK